MADVLFGDYNPAGKLPVTFYKSTSQLPDYEDYSMRGRTYRYFSDPLFAFGYGQSYTTFEITDGKLNVEKASLEGTNAPSSVFNFQCKVKNTGRRDGTEVVQLYLRDPSDADGPLKSLRGFQRVSVKAGQTADVTIRLTPQSFEFWDAQTNTMRVKPGRYELFYGSSSRDVDLQKLTVDYQ